MLLLLAVLLTPVITAGWMAVQFAEERVTDRVSVDLGNVRRLEAARINDVLDRYSADAVALAAGEHVTTFTRQVVEARERRRVIEPIGGYDGFGVVDPFTPAPLDELADRMLAKARASGAEVLAVTILDTEGAELAATAGASWQPYDTSIVERSLFSAEPMFGNAFVGSSGEPSLGVVTPILGHQTDFARDRSVGAAVYEMRLAPITDLLLEHERNGETTEAHIAQPNADGDAEFITLLRFERDAAFAKVVPAETNLPINQSLDAVGGRLLRADDYRQQQSLLSIETIERTGWGLVVKIDQSEAETLAADVRAALFLAVGFSVVTTILAWAVLLRPLTQRLRKAGRVASRVADGDYGSRIGDPWSDEVGEMARSIDRLAADLAADIARRDEAEHRLRQQATRDGLTGLLNRKRMTDVLDECDQAGVVVSVLFADLDGFKTVNDTFGHEAGDEVLITIAERLVRAAGPCADVARWGGDEFVVALRGPQAWSADDVERRITAALEEPVTTSVGEHEIRASIGFARSGPEVTARAALSLADAEMFRIKHGSRGDVVVASETLRFVESALADDRVEVWFQPIVETGVDGAFRMVGVEALARIRSLDGTLAAPASFLPEIRDMHLGSMLDRRVIGRAIEALGRWFASGALDPETFLSFNLSGASSRDVGLPAFVLECAAAAGVHPEHLVAEVSEETRVVDAGVLESLRRSGLRIAIDDIGLRHSNVDRLVDLGADIAKIDQRWAAGADMAGEAGDRHCAALAAITSLCRELGMEVIAEGIERESQIDMLAAIGVPRFHGYFAARPMPAAELERTWLHVLDLVSSGSGAS